MSFEREQWSLFAGCNIELRHTVIFVRCCLSWGISLTLIGFDVQQNGLRTLTIADILQDWDEVVEIVPIDRANVVEAKLLKQSACVQGEQTAASDLLSCQVATCHDRPLNVHEAERKSAPPVTMPRAYSSIFALAC